MKQVFLKGIIIFLVISNSYASKMNSQKLTPLGAVFSSNGIVFPKDKARMVVKSIYFKKDTAYNGDDEVMDASSREMTTSITNVMFRYGLGNNFDIRAIIPYVYKNMKQTYPKGPRKGHGLTLKNSGIGDAKVFVRYQILNQKKLDPVFLAFGLGLKVPTGDTSKSFTTIQGEQKTPTMQLGSGSWDVIGEIGMTKMLPNSRIDTYASYTLKNEGSYDYEFGDQINWNVGYSYALNYHFDLQCELNGIHMQKNKSNGKEVDNSGGNFIYITPGIHTRISKKYDVSLGYAHMIYRDNNYDIAKKSGGLSEDSRWVLKLGYNF